MPERILNALPIANLQVNISNFKNTQEIKTGGCFDQSSRILIPQEIADCKVHNDFTGFFELETNRVNLAFGEGI